MQQYAVSAKPIKMVQSVCLAWKMIPLMIVRHFPKAFGKAAPWNASGEKQRILTPNSTWDEKWNSSTRISTECLMIKELSILLINYFWPLAVSPYDCLAGPIK